MKRVCDIFVSGVGLLILSPLFLFLAIWIKCDSQGPIFFRQIRVGRYNRDFRIFKFRTMYVGSDKDGLLTVGEHDARITRSGHFMRKHKLDEFPQLINVLRGEMSIVGPRPVVRRFVEMYNEEQMHVLDVRPGITDRASILYRHENELLEKAQDPDQYYIDEVMPIKIRLNLEYVRHHNLRTDIKLIFQTIWSVYFKR